MKGSAFSTYLLAGTALALSMGSTPSMAQGNTAEQASAAGGSGTGQDGSGLADIIVTAQKRTERAGRPGGRDRACRSGAARGEYQRYEGA